MPPRPRDPSKTLIEEAYELLGGPLGGVLFGPDAKPPWAAAEPRPPTDPPPYPADDDDPIDSTWLHNSGWTRVSVIDWTHPCGLLISYCADRRSWRVSIPHVSDSKTRGDARRLLAAFVQLGIGTVEAKPFIDRSQL
jgi:hypothetical protein